MEDELQDMMAELNEVDMDDQIEDLMMSSNSLDKEDMPSSGNGLIA